MGRSPQSTSHALNRTVPLLNPPRLPPALLCCGETEAAGGACHGPRTGGRRHRTQACGAQPAAPRGLPGDTAPRPGSHTPRTPPVPPASLPARARAGVAPGAGPPATAPRRCVRLARLCGVGVVYGLWASDTVPLRGRLLAPTGPGPHLRGHGAALPCRPCPGRPRLLPRRLPGGAQRARPGSACGGWWPGRPARSRDAQDRRRRPRCPPLPNPHHAHRGRRHS